MPETSILDSSWGNIFVLSLKCISDMSCDAFLALFQYVYVNLPERAELNNTKPLHMVVALETK